MVEVANENVRTSGRVVKTVPFAAFKRDSQLEVQAGSFSQLVNAAADAFTGAPVARIPPVPNDFDEMPDLVSLMVKLAGADSFGTEERFPDL